MVQEHRKQLLQWPADDWLDELSFVYPSHVYPFQLQQERGFLTRILLFSQNRSLQLNLLLRRLNSFRIHSISIVESVNIQHMKTGDKEKDTYI